MERFEIWYPAPLRKVKFIIYTVHLFWRAWVLLLQLIYLFTQNWGRSGRWFVSELTMYTEHEEKEFLYPNVSHCKALKNCWKYFLHAKGLDHIKGFYDRQEKLEQALNLNGDNKLSSIHLKDIVSAMMVSAYTMLILTLIQSQQCRRVFVTLIAVKFFI